MIELRRIKDQRGFTLVEIAIVLVIIGIILGGVLKGQEMINNARMKNAYNAEKGIMAAIYSYYDRYGKWPGDDNLATQRWTGTRNGDGNGLIEGGTIGTDIAPGTMFTCAAGTDTESCAMWEHLRLANLIAGDATIGAGRLNPTHAYGGVIGVANIAVQGTTRNWIGLTIVPTQVVQAWDTAYDDGFSLTGDIRAIVTPYAPISENLISAFFRL